MDSLLELITAENAEHAALIILLVSAVWIWLSGLVGMFRTANIHRTYGSLISGGWAFLRLVRAVLTTALLTVIVGNTLMELAGVKTELLIDNVIGFFLTVFLNWLVIIGDKKRFYARCDRRLAKQIIRAEWQMACSILTRFSLVFTIGTIATLFVATDTADYYLGNDGKIHRTKDLLSL